MKNKRDELERNSYRTRYKELEKEKSAGSVVLPAESGQEDIGL